MNRILPILLLLALLTACAPVATSAPAEAIPSVPAVTDILLPSETPTATLSPEPPLGIGSSQVSPVDGMTLLYVPAASFAMGSTDGYPDELPVHTVTLAAFWVDQTEVTNAMYILCEQAGACTPPSRKTSNLADYYYGYPDYAEYPVLFVTWQDAVNYCAWAGRRLPTEAEWELAARGTDGRLYPWGAAAPDETLLNFKHHIEDVTSVGSYPDGASPFGALDMAGNVLEWTSDWYAADYYSVSPEANPAGPDTGTARTLRGGAWTWNERGVTSTHRFFRDPASASYEIGFRCVLDATP